ncbi:hypothetical protein CJU89_5341 [Yarrowia sp. B02]|nr:hypothetical protein CJU89_5341 [Yarrowia sp. B02]
MIFHAHEILLEASRIAPKVKTHMHLLQYRQLLTTGIASLEAVIHDANCPEHTKAYTSYILAQVLFAETESLGRVLSALGQGMILAERNGLSDLQLQMECLNVRALCRTNRNAAMLYCNKCLDKYPEMHGNYAFHTLQLLHFDLTLDNSLPQAFAISKSWEELPDSIPKSFLLLYSISKSLDYNVGNYEESQDTLEKMRMFEESSAMLETVPQVVMLRHMVTLLVTLRRDDDTPVKKASEALETVLRTLDRTAKTNGNVWENWNRDGTIKLLGEQGSTFSIQWLSQNQCESFCHYLLGLAGLRHHASLEYGRGLLQDCLELINLNEEDAPGGF